MTKTNPQITCSAAALSKAADLILARGDHLTKNGVLNALATAIAGPGHDWGYLKGAPEGSFVQPGLAAPDHTATAAAPKRAWVLHFDERDTWSQAPQIFASKEAALAFLATSEWIRVEGLTPQQVIDAVDRDGEFTWPQDEDDYEDDKSTPFQIWLSELDVAPAPEADEQLATRDAACGTIVLLGPELDPGRGLEGLTLFANSDDLHRGLDAHGLSLLAQRDEIEMLRDMEVTADFRPEVWVNDWAMAVDPEGDTSWTVHAHEVNPKAGDLDYLKESLNAPQWVRDWTGPFEITITATRRR